MPKVKLNPCIAEFSGTIGDFIFRKSRGGEAIVSRRPRKSNAEPSEAQKAHPERFKLAVAYARAALADPASRAVYEEIAAKERVSAFTAAQTDYLNGKDLLSRE
jgi:hypothetical protein